MQPASFPHLRPVLFRQRNEYPMIFIRFIAQIAILTGCATTTTQRRNLPPLEAVAAVDLDRYVGTWFEIANFLHRFQRGCTATTATYTLRSDGDIDVLNRCRKETVDGDLKSALGRARVVDPATNAKLQVSFFRPFWGDYWVIDLDEDYQYAVVGHPGRDYLWILSRSPTMADATYQSIVNGLQGRGYETSRLVRTPQISPDKSSTQHVHLSEYPR
jgi:apolipoprotein D and lipocalin family protein